MSEQTYAGHTLAEIKAAAESATPGPWYSNEYGTVTGPVDDGGFPVICEPMHRAEDGAHIAKANPDTVLAMAARIEELGRDAARWKCWLRMATTLEGLTVLDQMVDALERCPAGHVTPETFTAAIAAVMEQTKNREGA